MRRLALTETGPSVSCRLSVAEAEALAACDIAAVSRTSQSGWWEVAAARKVGVARVGDLQISVRPKVPVERLLFLVGYAHRPDVWRDHSVLLDREAELPEALGEAFRRLATQALEQGLLHGYRLFEESSPVLRGRLRVGDQLARRHGLGIPLEISYDDFTADIAENQLLLAAAIRLLRTPSLSPRTRGPLHRVRAQLADVTPLVRGVELPRWMPSRLNVRYQPALTLADLILAGDSFEQRVGDIQVSGFLFDMWRIFEDFVCVAFREAFRRYSGTSSLQRAGLALDEHGRVNIRPDLIWSRDGVDRVVVDAKYKAERPAGFPEADLYQLLAYCTVLGLDHGHLVYAAGNEVGQVHKVRGADVTISCHVLDLDQRPDDLLARIGQLAEAIVTTAQ